jgi:hypothetical protein
MAACMSGGSRTAPSLITDPWGTYIELNQRPNQKYLQY